MNWAHLGTVIVAAFLASLVECVEALTIVMAVGTTRGWRPALTGAGAGAFVLTVVTLVAGPALQRIPLTSLQLVIGVLLLIFGMRWLVKAILRASGVIGLHDEAAIYAQEKAVLARDRGGNRVALLTAFKAVILEGLEIIFVVIAVGAHGLMAPAAMGAVLAAALVTLAGFAVRRPLARVPENALKFAVGVLLSAFGVFWIGEGLGYSWPGRDLSLLGLLAVVAAFALLAVAVIRRPAATRRILGCVAIVIACIPRVAHAQAPTTSRPAYDPERYDEDWSLLRDPTKRSDFFDPIKWIPLGKNGSWFVTLGGELRERLQDLRNSAFGLPSPTHNRNGFHRVFVLADIHVGPHFRTFAELVNGEIVGATTDPSPAERDPLDVLQAFADLVLPVRNSGALTLRGGRQEMALGSARLVSFRDTPNVRRAFDGARAFWTANGRRLDAFVVRPVDPRLHVFDDIPDRAQLFWGIYATGPVSAVKGTSLDLYYLGLHRNDASFAQGTGREHRHTIGARLFGTRTGFDWHEAHDFHRRHRRDNDVNFDWDVEGAFQFGSFANTKIRAWMISSDWGYTLADVHYSPRLGLKADALSGDRNLQDNRLGTFNPFYPGLQYYSQVGLFAPANLLNLQPNITLDMAKEASVNLAWSSLWRESAADAFYQPAVEVVPGTATSDRHIGQEASANLAWQATVHLTITATYAHFAPGGSVRKVGGRSGDYLLALGQFKF